MCFETPVDQYFIVHPEELLDMPPERAALVRHRSQPASRKQQSQEELLREAQHLRTPCHIA